VEIGPTGIFDSFLKRFGTTSPQIAVVSSTIIVAFGFEKRIDVGVWTVVWILTFVVSYLVSDLLPKSTKKAVVFCLVFLLGFAVAAALIHALFPNTWGQAVSDKVILSTVVAYALAQPTAVILAAYQYLARSRGMPLPARLAETAEREIWGVEFYRDDMRYEIDFMDMNDKSVTVKTALSYKITNRMFEKKKYPMTVKYYPDRGTIKIFKIDHKSVETSPNDLNQLGLRYEIDMPPRQTRVVETELIEQLPPVGSEMFTTYYPTTKLVLIVRNNIPDKVGFEVEHFAGQTPETHRSGNEITYVISDGLLPFQGFRLHWQPKPSEGGSNGSDPPHSNGARSADVG
jgi:hypothetical protein